jgi:predicted GIY-YIG superfamily endonuclease
MPRKQRFYYVYILSSLTGTLYTGITNSIYNRTLQHKGKEPPGFTSKYDVDRLVITKSSRTCGQRFAEKKKSRVGLGRKRSR